MGSPALLSANLRISLSDKIAARGMRHAPRLILKIDSLRPKRPEQKRELAPDANRRNGSHARTNAFETRILRASKRQCDERRVNRARRGRA